MRLGDFRLSRLYVPDPWWFGEVVEGSVLREKDGPFRIVRECTRRRCDNRLMFVSLVIRHRSWTGRATTCITASDLKTRGFRLVPNVRVKPKTLLDVRIYQSMYQPSDQRPYIVGADEVVGLP